MKFVSEQTDDPPRSPLPSKKSFEAKKNNRVTTVFESEVRAPESTPKKNQFILSRLVSRHSESGKISTSLNSNNNNEGKKGKKVRRPSRSCNNGCDGIMHLQSQIAEAIGEGSDIDIKDSSLKKSAETKESSKERRGRSMSRLGLVSYDGHADLYKTKPESASAPNYLPLSIVNEEKIEENMRTSPNHSSENVMLSDGKNISPIKEPLVKTKEESVESEIMIAPSISLQSLIEKSRTDHKYGYLTLNQIFEFGLRFAFEDEKFMEIFFCTYKTFTSPKLIVPTLLNSLSNLIPKVSDDDEKNFMVRRASNLLSNWVKICYSDFQFDRQVVEELFSFMGNTLSSFLATEAPKSHLETQERVVDMCEAVAKKISGIENKSVKVPTVNAPKPIVMSKVPNDPRTLKLEDINPVELARQLTLMEFTVFQKVNAEELLGLGWMKDSKEWTAPNITQIISRSNQVTDWVTTYIITTPNLKKRINAIRHFLQMAEACYEMKNFNTLFEIMMALVSHPIYRLRRTWDGIGRVYREKYTKYETITSFAGSRRNYREELKQVNLGKEPCLPYLGVHLTDLVFFDQGNAGYKFEGKEMYINLTKRSQMALVVNQLTSSQKYPFSFVTVEYIQQFMWWQLNANVTSDEELLHNLSKEIEP